ncbi:hypothetical protein L2E82_36534 [Cichorium intybus]|uniref:Uncharacterized protein n=1 Tax=Cichorium intybus TaxID=13427 RepID=A0ACB9BRT6_CICIN|nr:hypothetical protein L2E82_36534 [Cichorium intybus]
MGRKIKAKQKQQEVNKTDNQVESLSQDNICRATKGQVLLNTANLSNKYQPRLFQEIVGHSIVVKTLSNAIKKKKIAPLYLFHGPNGTGKTSTARVFAMALNCESTCHNAKPCCSCKGCSRSLYTMDLCSANSISGFGKIKTLLHNTSFAHAIPGLKVFIIEECHLLTVDAWDELMRLVEGPYASNLVFMLITTDANSITGNISSRCQKFYFRKLNDEDVTEKLSRILVHERMGIEKEALKLIVAKSEGSLRDAENILDQLTLLGTTINTSIAQQLVGLIPEDKLLELLAVAVSGDTINTIRYAKKLSESVEPSSFVSQLANLITKILSESEVSDSSSSPAQRNRSQLSKTQSARLCYILKLLVETERQLRSSNDQTSSIIAAFLDIASLKKASSRLIPTRSSSSTEITRERQTSSEHQRHDEEKSSRGSLSDMEKLWKDVLKGIESPHTQRFLRDEAKLALLCISRINAIIHLTFTRQEDKMAAEISEESLSKALEVAIGCPVSLHMSLEQDSKGRTMNGSHNLAFDYSDLNRNAGQSEGLKLTKSKSCSTSQQPHRYSTKGRDLNTVIFENPTSEYHLTTQRTNLIQEGDSKSATETVRAANRPRHRWLSLSSIPQSDASVEPYSQDVIYENSNKDGDDTVNKNPKFQKGFSKTSKDRRFREPADQM